MTFSISPNKIPFTGSLFNEFIKNGNLHLTFSEFLQIHFRIKLDYYRSDSPPIWIFSSEEDYFLLLMTFSS